MPEKNQPGVRFLKNNLCTFAQKYKPNFYQRENISLSILGFFFFFHFILSLRSTVYVESVAKNNFTIVTEFILMGFTGSLKLEIPLFLVFLSLYLVTLLGNIGMMILIQEDVQLHTQRTSF